MYLGCLPGLSNLHRGLTNGESNGKEMENEMEFRGCLGIYRDDYQYYGSIFLV